MSKPASREGRLRIISLFVLVSLILAGLATAWRVSANRAFQVDEVEHLHAAYNLRTGGVPYVGFHQIHPPALHFLLYPSTNPDDAETSYLRGRRTALWIFLTTLLLCAACAARLSNPLGGALAAGLALSHTTLVERGIEIRPDNPLNLLAMAALYLEVRADKPSVKRFIVQGLLLGTGLLFSQKTAFPSFAFGCLWLLTAIKYRKPLWVALPVLAWTVPIALSAWALASVGALHDAVISIFGGAFDAASGADHRDPFGPWKYLKSESARNVAFVALGLTALARASMAFAPWLRDRLPFPPPSRALAFPAFFGLMAVASLWLNPFPWPYVHVAPAWALAVLAGAVLGDSIQRAFGPESWKGPLAACCVLALAAYTSAPRLLAKAQESPAPNGQAYQLFMLKELHRVTEPDDAVFDLIGLYFRPDAYPAYNLSKDLMGWYEDGAYPRMIPMLRENEAVAFLRNYRTGWLPDEEKAFVKKHFVQYVGNIYLLGTDLSRCEKDQDYRFEVLKTKPFRYDGPGEIEIGGRPFVRGILGKGVHAVRVKHDFGAGRIIMETPPPYPRFATGQIPAPGKMFVSRPGKGKKYVLFD